MNLGQVQIRPAQSADGQRILTMVAGLKPDDVAGQGKWWRDTLPELMESREHHVLLAEADAHLLGFVSAVRILTLEVGRPFLYVDMLWVEPEYRGDGIGTLLLEACVAAAEESGCVHLSLTARPEARGFFHAFGMEEGANSFFVLPLATS